MTLTAIDTHNWQRSWRYFFRSLSGIFRVPQYSIVAHSQCCWNRSSQNRFPAQWKLGLNPPIYIVRFISSLVWIFLRAEKPFSGGTPTVLAQCRCVLERQPEAVRFTSMKVSLAFILVVCMMFLRCHFFYSFYVSNFSFFGHRFVPRYCRIFRGTLIFECYFATY